MSSINQLVGNLIGRELTGEYDQKHIVSELNSYIKQNGGDEYLIDDDVEYLLTIATLYSDKEDRYELVDKIIAQLALVGEAFVREGPVLDPLDETIQYKFDRLIDSITKIHLDIDAQKKKEKISFINSVTTVFTIHQIRAVKDMPYEFSFALTLCDVKSKDDLKKLIPQSYFEQKTWRFYGKQKRCEGRYFTSTELIELLYDRKIIRNSRYE